jgi:pyrroline-5-carboxylate reductase
MTPSTPDHIAFIGGGNMASAIIGGLLKQGTPAANIQIIEPWDEQRAKLQAQFGITAAAAPDAALARAGTVVWAVKPQSFREAASQAGPHTRQALHLSVAAGIRSDSIAGWLGTQCVVRAMPNTPALVGLGVTGLFARPAVTGAQRQSVQALIETTGQFLWLDEEQHLDAVTALSGSGPAYVFYFIEAMMQAGVQMGLSPAQARTLAIGTFTGASALAAASDDPPELLRARVTSKGGTTYAAITSMDKAGLQQQFMRALDAARQRAVELGDEFGGA